MKNVITDPYDNSIGRQLTVFAGSNDEDIETATQVVKHLSKDFGLRSMILVNSRDLDDKQKNLARESWPITYGQFSDGETKFQGGERAIKDLLDNKHIILVKHYYTPLKKTTINDNHFEIRMFGNMLQRASKKGIKPQKISLAAPYLPYVRAHSIEKYENVGFFQGDSLALIVKDWADAGIEEVIGVDPHSEKIWSYLGENKIYSQSIDPFKDPGRKDFRLYHHLVKDLSLNKRNLKLLELCPFVEYFNQNKKKYSKLSLVDPDAGSYSRAKNFAINTGIGLENIISFNKARTGEGKSEIVGIRYYSYLQEKDIKGRDFLIVDDLISSGGTAIETAQYLKDRGAGKVYIWASHNAGSDPTKLANSDAIDQVVMLDTVKNQESGKFIYLKKSGLLTAAASYKSHMNLMNYEFR